MKKNDSLRIKNITDLREHCIDTLDMLRANKIDVVEAGVTGKLYEGIISSIKVELEYSKALGIDPNIPFLGDYKEVKGRFIENQKKELKKLGNK